MFITELIDKLKGIEVKQRALEIEKEQLSLDWANTVKELKETIESTPNGDLIAMEYYAQAL